ncbi:MAG TPA: tetratricopeptide repeat protein, partial [Terriglobia bacterium]|nr:tetratricopeptide repeat protein [Terriglobia bacterium]
MQLAAAVTQTLMLLRVSDDIQCMQRAVQTAGRPRAHEAMQAREQNGILSTTPKNGFEAIGQASIWRQYLAQIIESPLFPVALIIAAVFLLYARALGGAFVSDDEQQILQNVFVTNLHLWRHIFGDSVWAFMGSGNAAKFYRPMMIFCFWAIYRLAGPEPFYFHLFQLFLFATGAAVLYVTGKELTKSKTAALIASLIWVIHPQKVEAVAWISALCDTGCGLFYLVAFYLFLRAEKSTPGHDAGSTGAEGSHRFGWLNALSWVAFVTALLFKEMALSFPLILVAYWFFHPQKGRACERAVRLAPYVVLIGAYLAFRRLALGHLTAGGHIFRITGKMLGDALSLLGDHTRIFFWPAHLSVYRVFHAKLALASPWPWVTLLALVAVFVFRKRQPDLAFFIFWWPLALTPCLDIRQLSNPVVADRMSYLPSAGLCLAFGFLLAPLCKSRSASEIARRGRAAAIAGVCVVFAFGWVASSRAIPLWNNNQAIVNYSLRRDPESGYVHLIHGWELRYRENDLAGAAREFETAARLNRESPMPQTTVEYQALIGLGAVTQAQGNLNAAIADYKHAIRVAPRLRDAYLSLGTLYLPHGQYAQAAGYFEKAVEGDR